MSMNAFVKACEAYEVNILMLKEKIGDLERKLAEQDMKIQAPIRNDNAFLLKLSAIRKYENASNYIVVGRQSDSGIFTGFPTIITSDQYDHAYLGNSYEVLFINNKLLNYRNDPKLILDNIKYIPFYEPKITEILIKCLSKSKIYDGFVSLSGVDPFRGCGVPGEDEDYPLQKAHLAVHLDSSNRLYLCLAISMNTPATEKFVLIELDDLSNKDYIEKNFNVENLLDNPQADANE